MQADAGLSLGQALGKYGDEIQHEFLHSLFSVTGLDQGAEMYSRTSQPQTVQQGAAH